MLFEEYFLKSFSGRLVDYTNPEIEVLENKDLEMGGFLVNNLAGEMKDG